MLHRFKVYGHLCLVLCLILLSISCGHPASKKDTTAAPKPKDEIIKLKFSDTKSRDSVPGLLSSIANDIEYIPLETTPECLLSDFVEITPSIYGYFVQDKDQVYRFLPDGKYNCKINFVGRGPNEYKCKSFFVDDTNKIIVSTGFYNHEFFFSDLNGKVQYTVKYPRNIIPNHEIQAIKPMGGKKFIVTYYNFDGQSKLLYSLLDYQGNILHEEFNPHFIKETYRSNGPGTISLFAYSNYGFYTVSGRLFYLNNPSDTIFSFREDFSKKVHALINTGGYALTKEEDIKIHARLLSWDLYKERRSNFYAGESERFLFLSHNSFGKSRLAVWDKANGRAIYNYYPDFKDDINNFETIYIYPTRVKDNCLFSDIQALNFIEYYKKNVTINRLSQNARITGVLSKISEDSNPVIIKVNLKK